jgi:flagellin-like hook-associated protein FlgL
MDQVLGSRAGIGTLQKDYYERELILLHNELEGLASAESVIRDTNYASEVSELVRAQILQEAALKAILLSRDSVAAGVLALIR